MCALTKLPDFTAEPPPEINFDVLRELAKLDGRREQHGSLVGTSAITALLLQELVEQIRCAAVHLVKMTIPPDDPSNPNPPSNSGADAASGKTTAAPAPAAYGKFGIVATVDPASVAAISSGVGGVLSSTVQQPFADVHGTLKTLGDGVAKLDTDQKGDRKRIDVLEPKTAATAADVTSLQQANVGVTARLNVLEPKAAATAADVTALQHANVEIMARLDRHHHALYLSGQQLLKLYGAVGSLNTEIADFERMMTEARHHVEAMGLDLQNVEDLLTAPDDPPPRDTSTAKKPRR